MDLPLWDLSDSQGYLTVFAKSNYPVGNGWQSDLYSDYGLVANQSCYYTENDWHCDFTLDYGRDIIEENALNEKSCVQVLRILIDKADEDIIKLEEDIVMLQCQLAFDDEDFSKPCSIALKDEIELFDILIQSLKKKITDDVQDFGVPFKQSGKLFHRLHDLVRPLIENYFQAKIKQTESSILQVRVLPEAGRCKKKLVTRTSKHNRKVEAKKSNNLLEDNERKRPSMDPDKKNTINPIQPSDPMVKDSRPSISSEKAVPGERVAITKTKVTQRRFSRKDKVKENFPETERNLTETIKHADVLLDPQFHSVKQITEVSRNSKAHTHAINKSSHAGKLLVKIERDSTEFPERTEALEDLATERQETNPDSLLCLFSHRKIDTTKLKVKLNNVFQAQHIQKQEGQGLRKKHKPTPETVQKLYLGEEIYLGSSSTENTKRQRKFGRINHNVKKDSRQQSSGAKIDDASEVNITSNSSIQKKRTIPSISKTITERKCQRIMASYDMNRKMDDATASCDLRGLALNSSLCVEDVEKLSYKDLRIIAKNQNLRGIYKLKKDELRKLLGLEPQHLLQEERESPANTK